MKVLIPKVSDDELRELEQSAPDLDLVACSSHEEALREAPNADAVFGFISKELLQAGTKLKWIQVGSAGVESYLIPEMIENDLVLTNAKGVYGAHLAEHTIAFVMALSRNLPILARRQMEHVWEDRKNLAEHEIAGETLLVVGLGGTGLDVAWRAHALKMRVIAVSRSLKPRPGFVEKLGGMERFLEYLHEADYVCICCALTSETKGMFGDDAFRSMKSTAYLTNVTRGKIVDTEALIRALTARQIAGAGLDVTDPEPLPKEHPLWDFENVMITPHTSGQSPHASARLHELVKENLRRFQNGEPLLNVVDKAAGY